MKPMAIETVRQQAKNAASEFGLAATVTLAGELPRSFEYGPCGKEEAEYFVPVYRVRFIRGRQELGVAWIPADEIRPLGRLLKIHLSLLGIKL